MKWWLGGDWPVGQWLIPRGAVVSGVAGEPPTWNGIALPLLMPINAMALDEDAGLMMLRWYEPEHWHRLVFGAGIDVDAIKTKATALASTARHPRHYVLSKV